MTVRFKGENLIDEQGKIIPIPYEDLKEACLAADYEALSIVKIVSEAIEYVFDLHVNSGKCRESVLFNNLENAIRKDGRYKAKKEKAREEYQKLKKSRESEKMRRDIIYSEEKKVKEYCNRLKKHY